MIAHCMFEQSGTFKNEFKKLGYEAIDYDIKNDYGQTDRVMDLFEEINKGYAGGASVFDEIGKDDIILAFFPCVRFECQVQMMFKGHLYQQKSWSIKKKLEKDLELHDELHFNYMTLTRLVLLCISKGLKLMIENPATMPHYLTYYWALDPAIVDNDRTLNGDYMKKPTQYFFVNMAPKNNIIFEPLNYVDVRVVDKLQTNGGKSRTVQRSEISPQYASRFIRQFLIDLP